MNTKLSKKAFSWIGSFFKFLIPPACRGSVDELKEHSASLTEFSWKGVELVFASNCSQTLRAFRLERLLLESGALYVPFLGTPLAPAAAAVAPVALAYRIREGFIDPGQGTPSEIFGDVVTGMVTTLLTQVVFWRVMPSLLLPQSVMMRAIAIGVFLCCVIRTHFHLRTPGQHRDVVRGAQPVRYAFRMNAVWCVMCAKVSAIGVAAVHDPGVIWGRLWGAALVVLFGMSRGFEGNILFRYLWADKNTQVEIDKEDSVIKELKDKKRTLWQRTTVFEAKLCEAAFFFVLALSFPVAIWQWFFAAGPEIDWPAVLAATAGVGVMMALWPQVQQVNREAAEAIDEQIEERLKELKGREEEDDHVLV